MDATDVRTHLERLQDGGVGLRQVAALIGMSKKAVLRIRMGVVRRVRTVTADQIFAVTERQAASGMTTSAVVTRKRVHDLLVEGWTLGELEAQSGLARRTLLARGTRVKIATAARVAALHRALTR